MYFLFFELNDWGKRLAAQPQAVELEFPKINNRIANPSWDAMRYLFRYSAFPSDGISRIRFTGQSQQAHSQPDPSGPPKTYLLCAGNSIAKQSKYVKSKV